MELHQKIINAIKNIQIVEHSNVSDYGSQLVTETYSTVELDEYYPIPEGLDFFDLCFWVFEVCSEEIGEYCIGLEIKNNKIHLYA